MCNEFLCLGNSPVKREKEGNEREEEDDSQAVAS
jgi:hypothetical protein